MKLFMFMNDKRISSSMKWVLRTKNPNNGTDREVIQYFKWNLISATNSKAKAL